MRRVLGMISVLILVSLACQTLLPTPTPTPLPSATPSSTPTFTPTYTITPTSPPSATSLPSETVTLTPVPPSTLPGPGEFSIRYHPDDALYVGDLVSLEIIEPQGIPLPDAQLTVQVDSINGPVIGPASFGGWGIAGREQATLLWAWDTSGLSAGDHTLYFSIQPQAITWTETVTLLPAGDLPKPLAQATWATLQTACCDIHYITNTATERDIQSLSDSIEGQAQQAAIQMSTTFDERVVITILPRLLGHGGFTSSEIAVSYLDRNYAANDWDRVVHHEMVHMLDGRLGGDLRPTIFVEGLAVYMSGGHYKPEPLMQRAAVLLNDDLNWYLPLGSLTDDFYASQHEIGYLQAGALIEYMVQKYGWESFSAFYRDIHPAPSGKQSDAIDDALQRQFNISFEQLEQDYITALEALPNSSEWVDDVYITVTLFDTLRRYQELLDPSAYFRTAWLLDSEQMRQRSITADYLRHPIAPENLALETMLVAAGEDLDNAPYPLAKQLLEAVNAVLDAVENGASQPFKASSIAEDYYSIVQVLLDAGYEPQKINLDGLQATAQVGQGNAPLEAVNLQKTDGQWVLR